MSFPLGLTAVLLAWLSAASSLPGGTNNDARHVEFWRRPRSAGGEGPGKCLAAAYNRIRVPLDEWPLGGRSSIDAQRVLSVLADDVPPLEVHELLVSGASKNRVDLVFFSDGYLPNEKAKFLSDARRLVEDVSGNQTFHTVKPLLNFWAAFSPSAESGIGVGGQPKNTPFGLFRDGTELRAVYYGKPEAASAACASLGDHCDYPILLGNDPLYGGLGGDFTVVTSSLANGPLVLRHELGHSIIGVGEEYDGGFAYFGPNAANEPSSIPWSHWLPNSNETGTPPRIERSVMPVQAYPWTMLNKTTPWAIKFTSSGQYSRHLVKFSLSGIAKSEDLKVELDGDDLGWVPRADIGVDRWHYDIHREKYLDDGLHEVKFTLRDPGREGTAQLCSVEVLEFGDENEFVSRPGYYGIFPTFSETNETTYRPCTEGLWLSLLKRVELIDEVTQGCERHYLNNGSEGGKWYRTIDAHLVPLAQLRSESAGVRERLVITWRKDGEILKEFVNSTTMMVEDERAVGEYELEVRYVTEEIRLDSDRWSVSGGAFSVRERCA